MELGILNESMSTRYLDIPISFNFCCIFIQFGLICLCKFELTFMLCLSMACIHILEFELWRKIIVCESISLWVYMSKFVLVSEFCLFSYMVVLEFMNVMLYVYVHHCYVYVFLSSWLITLDIQLLSWKNHPMSSPLMGNEQGQLCDMDGDFSEALQIALLYIGYVTIF
jgi:hypothetical protein